LGTALALQELIKSVHSRVQNEVAVRTVPHVLLDFAFDGGGQLSF
jgi:hypothetical protein